MKNTVLIFSILLLFGQFARAEEKSDSATVHFLQGKALLNPAMGNNASQLNNLIDCIRAAETDSCITLQQINVIGAASPEGPVNLNQNLSKRRAYAIYDYLNERVNLPDSLVSFQFLGRDWKGLRALAEGDINVPHHDEVMTLLDKIIATATPDSEGDTEAIEQLQHLDNGRPYHYLYQKLYPSLRESGVRLIYQSFPLLPLPGYELTLTPLAPVVEATGIIMLGSSKDCKPFYMALKTNMLYDALALPNIGVEFYVGKNISVGGNWIYGWWDNNSRHRYWRAYGGDLAMRWWFGSEAHRKPLTGHHLGIYAGIITYDFEFGGTGYMGGLPHRTLWDRSNRVAGIEYGYSLPIARRLNIDFTLGVGYMGGKYIKYKPQGKCYLWQSTHKLNWFGPTKAEISLVWLIGCDNYNRKGGSK